MIDIWRFPARIRKNVALAGLLLLTACTPVKPFEMSIINCGDKPQSQTVDITRKNLGDGEEVKIENVTIKRVGGDLVIPNPNGASNILVSESKPGTLKFEQSLIAEGKRYTSIFTTTLIPLEAGTPVTGTRDLSIQGSCGKIS
ncbi:MAG: hypothetical protein WCO33_01965 [bacterium]